MENSEYMEAVEDGILKKMLEGKTHEIHSIEAITSEMFSTLEKAKMFNLLIERDGKEIDMGFICEQTGMWESEYFRIDQTPFVSLAPESIERFINGYYMNKIYQDMVNDEIKTVEQLSEVATDSAVKKTSGVNTEKFMDEYFREKELFGGKEGNLIGFSTGWYRMDEMTGGILPSEIWVVGAWRGVGKSFVGINMANSILNKGGTVAFFSTELNNRRVARRFVGLRAGVDEKDILRNMVGPVNERIELAEAEIVELQDTKKLHLFDKIYEVSQMRLVLKSILAQRKVDLVVIDFIQQLLGTGGIYEKVSENAMRLQMLARDLNVPLLILSQISNAVHKEGVNSREDGFKGAGEIGQIADAAVKIFRSDKPDGQPGYENDFVLVFTKLRSGNPGSLNYRIEFPGGRIYDPLYEVAEDTN